MDSGKSHDIYQTPLAENSIDSGKSHDRYHTPLAERYFDKNSIDGGKSHDRYQTPLAEMYFNLISRCYAVAIITNAVPDSAISNAWSSKSAISGQISHCQDTLNFGLQ